MTHPVVRGRLGPQWRVAVALAAFVAAVFAFSLAADSAMYRKPAAAAGVVCLAVAIVFLILARSEPAVVATLHCAKTPFLVGEELKGVIDAPSTRLLDAGVKITVACLHTTPGKKPTTTLIWADDAVIPATRLDRDHETCRIPFTFELPAEAPVGVLYRWEIGLYAVAKRRHIDTFRIAVDDPYGRQGPVYAERLTVHRKINVQQPGKCHIRLGEKRPKIRVQYVGSGMFILLGAAFFWLTDPPMICTIVYFAFMAFVVTQIARSAYAVSHSAIDVVDGKIVLRKGRASLQEIDAKAVRAIDIVPAGFDSRNAPIYEVQIQTTAGQTLTAAPFLSTRARATAIARKLEDALSGLDRAKVEALFGDALH